MSTCSCSGDKPKPLLVTAPRAAEITGLSVVSIYELAASGELEKAYVGKGTRNFRIVYDSLEAWVKRLPRDPVTEAG